MAHTWFSAVIKHLFRTASPIIRLSISIYFNRINKKNNNPSRERFLKVINVKISCDFGCLYLSQIMYMLFLFFCAQLIRAALTIVMKQRKNTELYAGRAAGATSSDSTMLLDNICDLICFFLCSRSLKQNTRERCIYAPVLDGNDAKWIREKENQIHAHFSNIYKQHSSESHASALFVLFFTFYCCGCVAVLEFRAAAARAPSCCYYVL